MFVSTSISTCVSTYASLLVRVLCKKINTVFNDDYLPNTDFRLQFKGEIDPGSNDFWNKEVSRKLGKETKKISLEVEEEKVRYIENNYGVA